MNERTKFLKSLSKGFPVALFAGSVILSLVIGMTGCATVKTIEGGRYDWTISESEECALVIGYGRNPTVITAFDNQTVQWNSAPAQLNGVYFGGIPLGGVTAYVYRIRVPAGDHILTGVSVGVSVIPTSTKYRFIAGKTYGVAVANGNIKISEIDPSSFEQ